MRSVLSSTPVCAFTTTSAVSTAASHDRLAGEIGITGRVGEIDAASCHSMLLASAVLSEWPNSFPADHGRRPCCPFDAALAGDGAGCRQQGFREAGSCRPPHDRRGRRNGPGQGGEFALLLAMAFSRRVVFRRFYSRPEAPGEAAPKDRRGTIPPPIL